MTQKKQPTMEELAKQAEEAMADLARTFPAIATSSVQDMKLALAEAMGTFDEERTKIIKTKLYPKAHDLKGQGATFGRCAYFGHHHLLHFPSHGTAFEETPRRVIRHAALNPRDPSVLRTLSLRTLSQSKGRRVERSKAPSFVSQL